MEHRNWLEVQPAPIPGILRGTLFLEASQLPLFCMESVPDYGHGRDTSNCSSVDVHRVKSVCYHQSCTLQYALQLTQDIRFYNGTSMMLAKLTWRKVYIRWLRLCETLM